jgi:hypothetical protein
VIIELTGGLHKTVKALYRLETALIKSPLASHDSHSIFDDLQTTRYVLAREWMGYKDFLQRCSVYAQSYPVSGRNNPSKVTELSNEAADLKDRFNNSYQELQGRRAKVRMKFQILVHPSLNMVPYQDIGRSGPLS